MLGFYVFAAIVDIETSSKAFGTRQQRRMQMHVKLSSM